MGCGATKESRPAKRQYAADDDDEEDAHDDRFSSSGVSSSTRSTKSATTVRSTRGRIASSSSSVPYLPEISFYLGSSGTVSPRRASQSGASGVNESIGRSDSFSFGDVTVDLEDVKKQRRERLHRHHTLALSTSGSPAAAGAGTGAARFDTSMSPRLLRESCGSFGSAQDLAAAAQQASGQPSGRTGRSPAVFVLNDVVVTAQDLDDDRASAAALAARRRMIEDPLRAVTINPLPGVPMPCAALAALNSPQRSYLTAELGCSAVTSASAADRQEHKRFPTRSAKVTADTDPGDVACLAIDPRHELFATVNREGAVVIRPYDADGNSDGDAQLLLPAELGTDDTPPLPTRAVFSACGHVVVGDTGGGIRVWCVDNRRDRYTVLHPRRKSSYRFQGVTALAVNDEGNLAASGGCDALVRIFDPRESDIEAQWTLPEPTGACVRALAFTSERTVVAVSDTSIVTWVLQENTEATAPAACVPLPLDSIPKALPPMRVGAATPAGDDESAAVRVLRNGSRHAVVISRGAVEMRVRTALYGRDAAVLAACILSHTPDTVTVAASHSAGYVVVAVACTTNRVALVGDALFVERLRYPLMQLAACEGNGCAVGCDAVGNMFELRAQTVAPTVMNASSRASSFAGRQL